MNQLPIRSLTIEPQGKTNAVFIGLHGLGADGYDFQSIAKLLSFPDNFRAKMIFPHAPQIPVTINNKQIMPAWYDIKASIPDREVDKRSVDDSHRRLIQLIEAEMRNGIHSKKIILAGFSQGGALACEIALQFHKPLGGLIILSSYLLYPEKVKLNRISSVNRDIPIFMAHGRQDDVVPFSLAEQHQKLLEEKKYNITWKSYENLNHGVCQEELDDLSLWLKQQI